MTSFNPEESDAQTWDRLRRNSRRAALTTAVGALIIMASFGLSLWQIRSAQAALDRKRDEFVRLQTALNGSKDWP